MDLGLSPEPCKVESIQLTVVGRTPGVTSLSGSKTSGFLALSFSLSHGLRNYGRTPPPSFRAVPLRDILWMELAYR